MRRIKTRVKIINNKCDIIDNYTKGLRKKNVT